MLHGQRLIVVLPAYNAEKTLEGVVRAMPAVVDHLILVDDASVDGTVRVARRLGLEVEVHPQNRGYGANQKRCYAKALEAGADLVVMLHPDGQHEPRLVPDLASLLTKGGFDLGLASRMQGRSALSGGMPLYKYLANRGLTAFQNLLLDQKLSEYHTGFRAYRREVLERLPYDKNEDGFLFDNQFLLQAIWAGFSIGEIGCPTWYGPETSSIRLEPALHYGMGVLSETLRYRRAKAGGKVPDWLTLTPGKDQAAKDP